jgi:nitrogen regulatory protein P-II 1
VGTTAVKKIICFVKPHRLEMVKSAIAALDVSGLSVADVRGTGNSPETSAWATVGAAPLPIRSRIEVVVTDERVEEVVDAILRSGRTGEPNDGKIFVEEVLDAIRVRTQESGGNAV